MSKSYFARMIAASVLMVGVLFAATAPTVIDAKVKGGPTTTLDAKIKGGPMYGLPF
jgi:hypothetical protein